MEVENCGKKLAQKLKYWFIWKQSLEDGLLNMKNLHLFTLLSPEFLAPSFSLFARATEQDQAASASHQLLSVNSELQKKVN